MSLYYLPVLIRSDRYFVTRLETKTPAGSGTLASPDFNFVIPAEDRVFTPMLTLEDPGRLVLNQMAPTGRQDIPLQECHLSIQKTPAGFELRIRRTGSFAVDAFYDEETGIKLDYSAASGRVLVGLYKNAVECTAVDIILMLEESGEEIHTAHLRFQVAPSVQCQRVVIDFGSEASQVGYKNCGPQSAIMQYDILENIVSRLCITENSRPWRRSDFLNQENGQPLLYRSFYAVRKNLTVAQRQQFPFNFTDNLAADEIRLFITRQEVAATEFAFREEYDIIPNLKLGIEKSLQLTIGDQTEDYSIRDHKKDLISAILLRLLRLMISTKPPFRQGGLIVTLLVPNIYTQHDVFELLNTLRNQTGALLASLRINPEALAIEFETISESDAAFMGYQQTHATDVHLGNGDMALVIDCGKGTTDISMVLADDNENYSSFFRTGFAGAGNVLLYGFAEDFLTIVLKALPGRNVPVHDFISKHIRDQHLTADVLDFIQLLEDQKKKYTQLQPVGITEFGQLAEDSSSTERTIGNLYKDPATLLEYACAILKNRSIRWDDEITGLIQKASDCIAGSIVASIRDVVTKDVKKRIKVVLLSGRAFYFDALKTKLESELRSLLGHSIPINTVPQGRTVNNKNVAIYGAFSGAYKITDFTGIPVDKKEGLSKNNDVLNNNLFLYRGIKIEPGNDILYNTSIVRRNHLELKAFKNKTVDIFFTRDNIYLRLMENQRVKEVRSLYSILSQVAESYSPLLEMKAISMFPGNAGDLASVQQVYEEVMKEKSAKPVLPIKKKQGILQFLHL